MAKDVLDDVKLSDSQKAVAKKVYNTAKDMGVDPELALATAWTENKFRDKTSPAGAIGIMQIMPKTAKAYGVDLKHLSHPDVNIGLGIRILKDNLERHKGDTTLALVTYNTTTSNVNKFIKANKDPSVLPKETQDYLQRIGEHYDLSGKAEEVSPFDTYKKQNEGDEGESPFSQRGELPEGFFDELPSQKQQSILDSIVSGAEENPELTSFGLAPFAAYGQYSLNKGQPKEDILGKQRPIPVIEEQFKAQQAGLENELNKLREVPKPPQSSGQAPQMAGDKWANPVTGSMGPGGDSVTEAARNYNIQKGIRPNAALEDVRKVQQLVENPKWRPSREGVILPINLAQQQQSDDFLAQQRAQDEATKEARAEVERRKAALAQQYQADIDEAIRRQSPLNRLGMSTGKFMTTSPVVTGGMQAIAGQYANEARERWNKGDLLGSAISGVKAVGFQIGGLPMSPRYRPLMLLKGAGQGAALTGVLADELRRSLGYDPEYKPYKK